MWVWLCKHRCKHLHRSFSYRMIWRTHLCPCTATDEGTIGCLMSKYPRRFQNQATAVGEVGLSSLICTKQKESWVGVSTFLDCFKLPRSLAKGSDWNCNGQWRKYPWCCLLDFFSKFVCYHKCSQFFIHPFIHLFITVNFTLFSPSKVAGVV